MTAMERVAWTELLVSVVTVATVTVLYPWLGDGATGAFALLVFVACGMWFLRGRKKKVVVDERDREIERRATRIGVEAAWMVLFLSLIVLVMWSSYFNEKIVATKLLTWLVWIQFAVCYGVKGLVGVLSYRRQRRAT